jgi:hypothetical protein
MGFKKKFDGVRVTTKAVGALAVARTVAATERLSRETSIAKDMVAQDLTIKRALSEQERRDNAVIEAALAVEKIDARIAALQERRETAVANLTCAKALANDVESLPVG